MLGMGIGLASLPQFCVAKLNALPDRGTQLKKRNVGKLFFDWLGKLIDNNPLFQMLIIQQGSYFIVKHTP